MNRYDIVWTLSHGETLPEKTKIKIYHPDAPQEDTIYVITPSPLDYEDVETREMVVDRLKYIGATNVQEISVEEALKKLSLLPFVLMIDSSGNFTKAIAASE